MAAAHGIYRLKIVWAVLCLLGSGVVAGLLAMSAHRPELMKPWSIAVLGIGISLAAPPLMKASIGARMLLMATGSGAGIAFMNGLRQGGFQKGWAYVGLWVLVCIVVLLAWITAKWIYQGFTGRQGQARDLGPGKNDFGTAEALRSFASGFAEGLPSEGNREKPVGKLRTVWLTLLMAMSTVMALVVFPYQMWTEGWAWGDIGGVMLWLGVGLYAYGTLTSGRRR